MNRDREFVKELKKRLDEALKRQPHLEPWEVAGLAESFVRVLLDERTAKCPVCELRRLP